jgi:hypothetical protein
MFKESRGELIDARRAEASSPSEGSQKRTTAKRAERAKNDRPPCYFILGLVFCMLRAKKQFRGSCDPRSGHDFFAVFACFAVQLFKESRQQKALTRTTAKRARRASEFG